MVTDQTSAHDRLRLSARGLDRRALEGCAERPAQHASVTAAAKRSIVAHVNAMLAFERQGI
jgi:urocanate hydratase